MPEKSKEEDKQSEQAESETPFNWKLLDMPRTYAITVIFACAVYMDSLKEDGIVNRALVGTQKVIIDVGVRGPIEVTRELLGLESTLVAKFIVVFFVAVLSCFAYFMIDRYAVREVKEGVIGRQFTPQLTVKQYEKQKMEFTRT